MKKVLILHGWHGSDLPHWQAWLAQELAVDDCIVAFPQLSNNQTPRKEVWIQEALDAYHALQPDIVICHSLGNILWFHMCEYLSSEVRKLLLVAVPRDLSEFDEVSSFFPHPIPSHLYGEEILMVASDNDPYMSLEESHERCEALGVPLHVIHDAGHISSSSGFGSWPWVKEWVLQ